MDWNLKYTKKRIKLKLNKIIGRTYYGKRKKKIVFVLSTGRCGSTSIVKMFNQHPKFSAFHEEIPELIKLSTELAENPERKKEIYKQLDSVFRNKIWAGPTDKIHVHSDHRLWNLVDFLSRYFPNAVFIHLLRNPYDSLKSFLPRNWYSVRFDEIEKSNIYEKYRLRGNRLGEFSDSEWESLSTPDKLAWYWNFVNLCISNQLEELDERKHPYIRINLEYITILMNTRIRELFNLEGNFFFKNVISNTTNEEKVISEISPEIYEAVEKLAFAKDLFYPRKV